MSGALPWCAELTRVQEISTRARLMPTIATALARMAIAESPSLRRKTMAMADEDDVAGGMEQGLWKLVMRHTITPRQRVSRTSGKPTGRHESAEGPLLVLDDDGSLDSVDGPTLAFEDGSIDDGPTLILGDDPGVSRRQESRSLELWDAVSSLSPSVSWSTRASSPSISPSLLRQQPGQQRRGPLSFEEQDDDAYEQRFPVTAPCAASSSQPLEIHDEPTTPPLQFYSDG